MSKSILGPPINPVTSKGSILPSRYNYIDQEVLASTLIVAQPIDSFFHPIDLIHSGYAFDGHWYDSGVVNPSKTASWFSEAPGDYRGKTPVFPPSGIILLDRATLVILENTDISLPLWMQFLLADNRALPDNFDGVDHGFLPMKVTFANGVISISYHSDLGSFVTKNAMIVHLDFVLDTSYLDVFETST